MRVTVPYLAITLGLAVTLTGCASPPEADVDAAKAAVDKATAERASEYAPESLKAAQEAQAAIDVELKAQEGKWFKSYDKTRELAVAAKAAGDEAAADALAGRAAAGAAAATAKAHAAARAKTAVTARAKADVAAETKAEAAGRAEAPQAMVRVGGRFQAPSKIKDVKPVYPAIAQTAHVRGAVTIEATIGPEGKVVDAKVVHSIPMLDQAALAAVRQWEYTPTLLNGEPVPVLVTVTINFTQ
jgi:TonB family protein